MGQFKEFKQSKEFKQERDKVRDKQLVLFYEKIPSISATGEMEEIDRL